MDKTTTPLRALFKVVKVNLQKCRLNKKLLWGLKAK